MEYEDNNNDDRFVSLESRTSCVTCPFLLERRPALQMMTDRDTGKRGLDLSLFRRRCLCTLMDPGCRSAFNLCPEECHRNTVVVEGMKCRVIPSWLVK